MITRTFTTHPLSTELREAITAQRIALKETLERTGGIITKFTDLVTRFDELEAKIKPPRFVELAEALAKATAAAGVTMAANADAQSLAVHERDRQALREAEDKFRTYELGEGLEASLNKPALVLVGRKLLDYIHESEPLAMAAVNELLNCTGETGEVFDRATRATARAEIIADITAALEPFFADPNELLSIAKKSPLLTALDRRNTPPVAKLQNPEPLQAFATKLLQESDRLLDGSHSFTLEVKDPRRVPTAADLAAQADLEERIARENEEVTTRRKAAVEKQRLKDVRRHQIITTGIDPNDRQAA